MSKIYVGNLSWGTSDETLKATFLPFGPVIDAIVMKDPQTGRSRGFGFVTFGSQQEADNAISAMNDQELDGRRLKVNVANQRAGGGGGGGGGFSNQSFGQQGGGYGGGYQNQGYQQQGYGQGGFPNQGGFNQGYGQPGGNWGMQGGAFGGQQPNYGGYPQQGGYNQGGGF